MLRLPRFRYHRPATVAEAVRTLNELGDDAMPVSGGTDLVPNMKHRLWTPTHVVSLTAIDAMRGIRVEASGRFLRIGALETLADVAAHPAVRRHCRGLADAAGLVAGPQIRNRATLGGNVCLDTRCTYYNQSAFWRAALGHCLKKDGTVCHVTKVGRRCVAAHSADTPGNLVAAGATLTLEGVEGRRKIEARDFFVADGIRNTRRAPGEILTEIVVPVDRSGRRRSAYRKLRQRRSIDFPLLSVAVVGDFRADGAVAGLTGVVSALGARPRILSQWDRMAVGKRLSDDLIEALAQRARAQCRPLANSLVDVDWRRAMVPVYVARALRGLR